MKITYERLVVGSVHFTTPHHHADEIRITLAEAEEKLRPMAHSDFKLFGCVTPKPDQLEEFKAEVSGLVRNGLIRIVPEHSDTEGREFARTIK